MTETDNKKQLSLWDTSNQGTLFSLDYLSETICMSEEWLNTSEREIGIFREELENLFKDFHIDQPHTEADTETELIHRIFQLLGWSNYLTQQNLSLKGREDVPDVLLFSDSEMKAKALGM